MKRTIGKHISNRLKQVNADMRELQRLMTHKSVYAKRMIHESRRPKHPKRMYYDYDIG